MYFKKTTLFRAFFFSWTLVELATSYCLEDCSVTYEERRYFSKTTTLSDYNNNYPKENEIVRTTMIFVNTKYPHFRFFNNGKDIYLNKNNGTHIGIFPYSISNNEPCSAAAGMQLFGDDKFTEVQIIVTKKGLVTVNIHGNRHHDPVVMSCNTKHEFNTNETSYLVYQSLYSHYPPVHMFYDC